jgi:hypothetical protein
MHATNQMLAAARRGDWSDVAELQLGRDRALHEAFDDPRRLRQDAAGIIRDLLDLNHEIAGLAAIARAAHDRRQRRRQRHAVLAYAGLRPQAANPRPV